MSIAARRDVAWQGNRLRGLVPLRLLKGLTGFLTIFLLCELLTQAELVNPYYLPRASTIALRSVSLLFDVDFLTHVAATMQAWAAGLAIAVAVAVPVGVLIGSSGLAFNASRILVEFLRPIPSVALIPVAILLLGTGINMKLMLTVYAAFWPIFYNTIYGIHDVGRLPRDTAKVFGFRQISILRRVALPAAAPYIYTGIRLGAAIVLIVAISAELLAGGHRGIGTWIFRASVTGAHADMVYAGTIITGMLGLLINWLLVKGEHKLLFWHTSNQTS